MKIDILRHAILNIVKSVTFWMKKTDRRFFKTILEKMLEHRTTVLSQLWNTDERSAKELKNYYSRHLWKELWSNFWEKVEKRMVKFIWKNKQTGKLFLFWHSRYQQEFS